MANWYLNEGMGIKKRRGTISWDRNCDPNNFGGVLMKAIDRIKQIEASNPPEYTTERYFVAKSETDVRFLLRAFKAMHEVAIENNGDFWAERGYPPNPSEVDFEFEKRMKSESGNPLK